jgi:hypothetical protein
MHPIDRLRGACRAIVQNACLKGVWNLAGAHPPHQAFESGIGMKRNEGWVDVHECAQTRSCVEAAIKPI